MLPDFIRRGLWLFRPAESLLLPAEAGPIEAVLGGIDGALSRHLLDPWLLWPYYHLPNLWWPDDRAWCVATEIDMQSSYIGGSQACVERLLGDDRLELYEVQPSDGVRWDADDVNPKPDEAPMTQ